MSFAQLEEAARNSIEEQQQQHEDAAQKGGNIRDKKGSVNRGGPGGDKGKKKIGGPGGHRDDEMQVYLSEIRQN